MTTDWGDVTVSLVKRLGQLDYQIQPGTEDDFADWAPKGFPSLFLIFVGAPCVKPVSRSGSGFSGDFEGRWQLVHAVGTGKGDDAGLYAALSLEQETRGKMFGFLPAGQVKNAAMMMSDGPGNLGHVGGSTGYIKIVTPYWLRQTIQAEGVIP